MVDTDDPRGKTGLINQLHGLTRTIKDGDLGRIAKVKLPPWFLQLEEDFAATKKKEVEESMSHDRTLFASHSGGPGNARRPRMDRHAGLVVFCGRPESCWNVRHSVKIVFISRTQGA